jgi:regulator of nucleoside diphosphate kinase
MIINEKDYGRLIEKIKQLRINAMTSFNIKTLSEGLKNAEIIHNDTTPPDLVTMNSKALIKRMDNGQEIEMYVVYHDDADSKSKKVSVFAPLGMALLGLRERQTFNCRLPNGDVYYQICKVLYQPEAAGDHYL